MEVLSREELKDPLCVNDRHKLDRIVETALLGHDVKDAAGGLLLLLAADKVEIVVRGGVEVISLRHSVAKLREVLARFPGAKA